MSCCPKYIPNVRNCSDIPPENQRVKTLTQEFNDNNITVSKKFAYSADSSYYPDKNHNWSSCDPRLFDQVRGFKTSLSRPPYKLDINCNLTNIDYEGKPNTYNKIQDINIGNRIYYYNRELAQPYIPTNFSIPSNIDKDLFIDPMTSVKPIYNRRKLIYGVGCNQPTRDQLVFREDMMERILRVPNQQNWEVYNNTK